MIKLKKIEPEYKNKFVVEISVDHGDSDHNELIPIDVDTEQEIINIREVLKNRPTPSSEGGNKKEYESWCDDNFGEMTIPDDLVYSSCRATVCSWGHKYYYYDGEGNKFEVEFDK
jgi:hypothetical protein